MDCMVESHSSHKMVSAKSVLLHLEYEKARDVSTVGEESQTFNKLEIQIIF